VDKSLIKKTIVKTVVRPLGQVMKRLEPRFIGNVKDPIHNPVFILGCPRSGSTLLYQAMVHNFKLSYFSNLMMHFPMSPARMAHLAIPLGGFNPPVAFKSQYGMIFGWNSPNQGLHVWNRWFEDIYDPSLQSGLIADTRDEMRSTILRIQESYDAPFVNKCQPLTEKAPILASVFPKSVFLRIRRDPLFIVQSILVGRRKWWSDTDRWFSTKPRNFEEFDGMSELKRTCEQVAAIENDMDEDFKSIGTHRVLEINYEDFCLKPHETMEQIAAFYQSHNQKFPFVSKNTIPEAFKYSDKLRLEEDELNAIRSFFGQ